MEKFLVIDGSSILFRAYYALPPMNTKTGKSTNAVLGFINILLKAMSITEPTHIAVCFDLKSKVNRLKIYEDYKANRSPAPEDLSEQFDYIKEILTGFNINYYELEGYEADDLAGTLSKDASKHGVKVFLLSGDKDYLQLVDEKTELLYTRTGVTELVSYDVKKIDEEYGITPLQIIDMKALMGDKSDNIPGIPGVGEKTALKLLKEFSTVENLYENIDKLPKNKTNQKIIDNKEMAFISKELATIDINSPIHIAEENLRIKEYSPDLEEILKNYELNSIINRLELNSDIGEEKQKKELNIIKNEDPNKILEKIVQKKEFVFKFLGSDKPYRKGEVFKIGLFVDEGFYINNISNNDLQLFKDVFENPKIMKKGFEIKEDILFLIDNNIDLKNYTCDIALAEYLLNPTYSNYSLESVAGLNNLEIIGEIPDKKLMKKYPADWDESLQDSYLINILNAVNSVSESQLKKLEDLNMVDLYNDIELPLVKVLADMEYTGVYIDKDTLLELGKSYEIELEFLVKDIHSLAGEDFNVNSPKQLAEILFEKLKLPVIKKTKTGYSTDIEVLEKLEEHHEIISYIIRYRTISKLKSTYVDGLVDYINEYTGRIHSNFDQTVAATGRLSSNNPNLQNIPVKTEEGRALRKIFTAKDENHKLVDADYSQIELRLLANISEDKNMIESFKNLEDIHTTTASKVFEVPQKDVSPLMRSRAKAVNFGIVYGISDYGLSQDLKISRAEAKTYIDNYLERFSGVAKYMKEIVEFAKENGYVETLFSRKRFLPELNSRNWNERSFGERIALNMPIQGTAADIIKIAMINVYNKLNDKNYKTKLILQIHDELILESPEEEIDEIKILLSQEMENAVKLKVPLTTAVSVGDTWYDTE